MTHSLERYAYSLPSELCAEIRKLIAENARYRNALLRIQVRIDETNHHPDDLKAMSEIAREALKGD